MEKNAEFIRNKEFHVVFKGYNPEEVDKFLDILSNEFERLVKKNRELQEALDRVKFESMEDEETDIKKIIQDALVSAHKVADEIKNQAKKDAEQMSEKIKQQEEKAFGEMEAKKAGLKESIIKLQAGYDEFKNSVTKAVEEVNQFISTPESNYVYDIEPDPGSADDALITDDNTEPIPGDSDKAGESEIGETNSDNAEVKIGETEIHEEKQGNAGNNEEIGPADSLVDDQNPKQKEEGLLRERKKIDIANPDIIENFFRTNNE